MKREEKEESRGKKEEIEFGWEEKKKKKLEFFSIFCFKKLKEIMGMMQKIECPKLISPLLSNDNKKSQG